MGTQKFVYAHSMFSNKSELQGALGNIMSIRVLLLSFVPSGGNQKTPIVMQHRCADPIFRGIILISGQCSTNKVLLVGSLF